MPLTYVQLSSQQVKIVFNELCVRSLTPCFSLLVIRGSETGVTVQREALLTHQDVDTRDSEKLFLTRSQTLRPHSSSTG